MEEEEPVVDTDIDLNFRIADRKKMGRNREIDDGKSLQSLTHMRLMSVASVLFASYAGNFPSLFNL